MTPCEEKGYEVGQVFECIKGNSWSCGDEGDIVVLHKDSGKDDCEFIYITGDLKSKHPKCKYLVNVRRIYPPEEKKTVSITCEGKTVEISRESAKALKQMLGEVMSCQSH